jgi:hypothetical protein
MKSRFSLIQLSCFTLFFSIFVLVSCKKETSQGATEETEASRASSESDAEAEMVFNAIFDDAMGANDDVGMAGTGVFGRTSILDPGGVGTERQPTACFIVTVIHPTANQFPVQIIIDFGTVGCVGPGGHVRRGKIITEYTNRLIIPGAKAVTTFDNFFIDDIKVEGTHTITNTSSPITTIPPDRQFTVDVVNARLTRPNGNFTEWNSHKTITQIEGLVTPNLPLDDVFRIEGGSSGRTRRGNLLVGWNSIITEPLIKRFNCRWIVKGRIRTTRLNTTTTSQWVAVLDFGNGVCDNLAVITINGVSYNITLH